MKITPKFDGRFDYRGSLFDDLTVDVRDANHKDDFAELMEPFGETHLPVTTMPRAWIRRAYWLSDRRYNPFNKSWSLDELIALLERAAAFGPVAIKEIEDHGGFHIERSRPEDNVLKVNQMGVFLKEWPFERLYRGDDFTALPAAISALKEIQKYLESEAL